MEYRILGPLALVEDERDLAPAGAKQQALLGIFLLHPGETLSRDRLIDELWGSRPPETAGNTLQVYVSQLRKLLPPGALVTRLPGYALEVDPESLDASRFERLARGGRDALARGDSAGASTALERALALWRGPVLAGVAFEGTAAGEAARLEELRIAAAEDRIDAGLALGRHAELVGELEALVAEHPLRERLRGQLMVALYRSGRQADALDVFQRTRAELVDQLGIEPGPQLQELQRAVLAQDPALAPPAPVEAVPAHETRKVVTVLAARLTHGGENGDPEIAEARQERLLEVAAQVVGRHGGALEPAPTEGLLALFGTTVTHEDDALRAVRAACDLHDAPAGEGIACGVVTGEAVIVGGRLAAAGNVVTSSLRLARSADPGSTLLSGRTLPLVRGAVDVQELPERRSDGIEGWRLVALRPDAEPISRRLDTPLVGREAELAVLRGAFEEARAARRCRLFTVLGEGGIGKSRLVAELVAGLGDDVVALKGRCRSYGDGIAFRPVAEILRAAAGDVTEEQIGALLEGEPDAGAAAGYLAAAAGSSDTLASTVEVDWAVRRLLEALARRTPLVVVLEDIHWAEPALLDLVELLPETVRDAPVLLLCLARPELLEERPRWDVSLLLEPLSAGESDLLIDRLLGDAELAPPVRGRVAEAAEGNPLYIEQALAFLSERGAEDNDLEMPPTTKALLDARLDRLSPPERDVLERAAVIGRELWPEALTALADHDEDLGPLLASLTRKELIEPTSTTFLDDAYRFRHKLIREAAYSALTKRRRTGLHERFADWLEGRAAERDEEYDDLLGYHLEQAAQYRAELGEPDPALSARAAAHLASAGRRALARSDIPAAVGLLSRAAALAAGDDVVRSALLVDLAEARRDAGDLTGADLALAEALELAERAGSAVAAQAARIGHLRIAFQTDSDLRVGETLPVVESAIAAFEAAGDDRELARALYVRAWISWLGCRAAEAEQALEAAIVHARRAGDDRAEASALHLLVGVALFGPMPVAEARRRCEEILETHTSKLRVTASALRALAGLAAQQGRFDEAEEFMARDRSITDELGTRLTAAAASELYGWVLMLADDLPAAELEARRGFDRLLEMGDRSSASTLAAVLAQILYAQGRLDEVLELTALGRDESSPDDLHTQIQWRGPRAKVLAQRGEIVEAERLALEGVDLAEATDFLNVRATALHDLAEVLLADGRSDEAAVVVAAATELFEEKGNVVGLARSRALV
ncbi:MAG TPA: BTAD domain-containing putative transcriptional regulator [Gaiellaceae bacterium]|nr:BTAD domain-containing putative transcriptional regulator [Gaiellaceae bacterium]